MRFSISVLAAAAVFALASAAHAAEHPAFAEMKAFCMANHGVAAGALAAADAAGWAPAAEVAAPVAGRTKDVGGVEHTLIVKHMAAPLPDGGTMQVEFCGVLTKAKVGDVKASARAFLDGQAPIVDDDGSWQWLYGERAGRRQFLADKSQATIQAALRDGPVVEMAAGADGDGGDTAVYLEIHRTPK